MNCLEFRRRLGIEPLSVDGAFVAHRDACAGCADAWSRARAFEQQVAQALAVPVPDGLAERILLRQLTESRHAARAPAPFAMWRIAAGVVLAIGAATLFWSALQPAPALPDVAVAHLAHEPYALSSRAEVSGAELSAAFERAGAPLVGAPVAVNYLQLCPLEGGRRAVHMVVQDADGPVTVLYVVDHVEAARAVFERRGVKGRLVPMGDGTLVLLASDDGAFDRIEGEFRDAMGSEALALADVAAAPAHAL
ncbi:MAG TPA: DUF3379 family protein [Xanthomonadales bacterium]|nr:DUF3379 family protein [Xanthomonadales bacterium]